MTSHSRCLSRNCAKPLRPSRESPRRRPPSSRELPQSVRDPDHALCVLPAVPLKLPAHLAALSLRHVAELNTRDFDFSDVRNYPPAEFAGIIVLELPDDAVAATVVKVMESLSSNPFARSNPLAVTSPKPALGSGPLSPGPPTPN